MQNHAYEYSNTLDFKTWMDLVLLEDGTMHEIINGMLKRDDKKNLTDRINYWRNR